MKHLLSFFLWIFYLSGCSGQSDFSLDSFFEFENEQYHYQDVGIGDETVIFLHGFALSSFSYTDIIQQFDTTKYRLIAIDLKGNGFSAKPKNSDYSIQKQAEIVQNLVQNLNINHANLVGHSYGGIVCVFLNYLQLENKLSFEIRTTTVIDTPASNKNLPIFMRLIQTKPGNFILLKFPPLFIRSRVAVRGGFHNYRHGMKHFLDMYKIILGQKEYGYTLHELSKQAMPSNFDHIIHSYKDFQVPFLILWGENDLFINKVHARKLDTDIPYSELVFIDKTSHNPHEEKPEEVYNLLIQFIESKL